MDITKHHFLPHKNVLEGATYGHLVVFKQISFYGQWQLEFTVNLITYAFPLKYEIKQSKLNNYLVRPGLLLKSETYENATICEKNPHYY